MKLKEFLQKHRPETPGEEAARANAAKGEKVHVSGSVETEDYDILPALDGDAALEEALSGKEGLEVEYSFNGDDVKEGLKAFQRATIFRKYWIYTLLLAVIFVIYTINAIQKPGELLSSVLSVVCVALIVMIWYLPAQHIRKTAAGADALGEQKFRMTLYDTCVRIEEEKGSFLLHFSSQITKTLETEGLFLLCVGKERVFMLPKRYLEGDGEQRVRSLLQSVMGERYLDRRKRDGKEEK